MNVCMKYKMQEYDRIDVSEGYDFKDMTFDYRIHFWYMSQHDAINVLA